MQAAAGGKKVPHQARLVSKGIALDEGSVKLTARESTGECADGPAFE